MRGAMAKGHGAGGGTWGGIRKPIVKMVWAAACLAVWVWLEGTSSGGGCASAAADTRHGDTAARVVSGAKG